MLDHTTKDRIVSYATEKFFSDGFAKTSVDEIVSALGISKKTFYKGFRTKDDLVDLILDRTLVDVQSRIEHIVGGEENFVIKLDNLLRFLATLAERAGRVFIHEVQRHRPELWKRFEDFRRRRILDAFSRLVEQGMREGHIRRDLNQRLFLLSFLATVENVVRPQILAHESFSAQEAIVQIIEIFFIGALSDTARKEFTPHPR